MKTIYITRDKHNHPNEYYFWNELPLCYSGNYMTPEENVFMGQCTVKLFHTLFPKVIPSELNLGDCIEIPSNYFASKGV